MIELHGFKTWHTEKQLQLIKQALDNFNKRYQLIHEKVDPLVKKAEFDFKPNWFLSLFLRGLLGDDSLRMKWINDNKYCRPSFDVWVLHELRDKAEEEQGLLLTFLAVDTKNLEKDQEVADLLKNLVADETDEVLLDDTTCEFIHTYTGDYLNDLTYLYKIGVE